MRKDEYDFQVGEKGQEGLDILDVMFNDNTQKNLLAAGLKPGMRILDIGCGRGMMSLWLASQVGPSGKVIAIDNNENQIKATVALTKNVAPAYLSFRVHSAYDIAEFKEDFDLVYCRFILHHLNSPTKVIEKVYDLLSPGGIFVAEEGIVSAAFSYPNIAAWGSERTLHRFPLEIEGNDRDGNFGMKLFHQMIEVGFKVQEASLFQPLLHTSSQKSLLAGAAREGYKQYSLDHGMSLVEWEKQVAELDDLIDNPAGCIGFYQSCLVIGKKE